MISPFSFILTCTPTQIDELFQYTLNQATQGAQADVSGYSGLCTCVQEVMIDMVFNLGQVLLV